MICFCLHVTLSKHLSVFILSNFSVIVLKKKPKTEESESESEQTIINKRSSITYPASK